jgi:transcriptional regulator with XRE-family HTH domain
MSVPFGELLKQRRREKGFTLRGFATRAGMDPGNLSKIERGKLDPPQDWEILARLCSALGYEPDDIRGVELRDLAAVQTGRIPSDILQNTHMMESLPRLLRTVHERQLSGVRIDRLIDIVRRA